MLGDLISAGVSLWNASQNRDAQRDFNAQQMQLAQQNMALQREFAQSGIQWRVQDAVKAGLHPLAALGNQGVSFSPVSVGGSAPQMDLGNMGQDISRALKAAMSEEDRTASQLKELQLERGKLENDVLRAELASKVKRLATNSASVGMPANTSVFGRVPLPRPGPDRTVGGVAVGEDDLKQKAEDHPATRVVRPFGYPLYANPWFNDGQQFEDRYGESELGSTLKAGVNTIADHVYTAYKRWGEPAESWRPRRARHNDAFIYGRR